VIHMLWCFFFILIFHFSYFSVHVMSAGIISVAF